MIFDASKVETNLEMLSTITYRYFLEIHIQIYIQKWCTNYIQRIQTRIAIQIDIHTYNP